MKEWVGSAAAGFLSLIFGGPTRIIVSGNMMSDADIEQRIRSIVGPSLTG